MLAQSKWIGPVHSNIWYGNFFLQKFVCSKPSYYRIIISKIELTVQSNTISVLFLGKASPHWPCSDQKSKQHLFLILLFVYIWKYLKENGNLQTSMYLSLLYNSKRFFKIILKCKNFSIWPRAWLSSSIFIELLELRCSS